MRRLWPRHVRSRMTLWYVLVLGVLLLAYAGATSSYLFYSLREQLDQKMLEISRLQESSARAKGRPRSQKRAEQRELEQINASSAHGVASAESASHSPRSRTSPMTADSIPFLTADCCNQAIALKASGWINECEGDVTSTRRQVSTNCLHRHCVTVNTCVLMAIPPCV